MRTVFVDVDDTLIIFKDTKKPHHHWGFIDGLPYKPNEKLIERLRTFKGNIVIWSGGGSGYAKMAAEAVLPEGLKYSTKSKMDNFQAVKEGDIIVDDQKLQYLSLEWAGVKIIDPFENWPE